MTSTMRTLTGIGVSPGNAIGPVTQKLYDTLTGIQYGRLPDDHNWVVTV